MKTSRWYLVVLAIGILVGLFIGGSLQGPYANAQGAPNAAAARFQISAFGTTLQQHGCYIVDTQTGSLWLTTTGGTSKVSDKLP